MFRMLQALEREPVNLATQTSKQGTLVSALSDDDVAVVRGVVVMQLLPLGNQLFGALAVIFPQDLGPDA